MDEARARSLLEAERERIGVLIDELSNTRQAERNAAGQRGDVGDRAESLVEEGTDDAIALGLTRRLAAIERAEDRLVSGTFGRSIASGDPIPDERLEADPAAELTVEEARVL